MHFYMHSYVDKNFILLKSGCYRKQVGAHHHVKNIMTTTRPLEMLCMDLFGHIAYISIGGNKYGLVIVNDYSRFT
jgi:hypothetical protein